MESKDYIIYFSDNEDYENHVQKVWSDNEDEKLYYIIHRDIFSGNDFIKAIDLGFRIAKRGYDSIVVKRVPWEE